MSEYTERAEKFLKDTNTTVEWKREDVVDRFPGDDHRTGDRWHYIVTVRRGDLTHEFDFYGSINDYQKDRDPSNYDLLTCLGGDYPYDDLGEFIDEYGYTIETKKDYDRINTIYENVKKNYAKVQELWGDVMEQLEEIN